jgi:hypothetical protein
MTKPHLATTPLNRNGTQPAGVLSTCGPRIAGCAGGQWDVEGQFGLVLAANRQAGTDNVCTSVLESE